MDTNIFNHNLSVEAVSAYILICALIDEGARPGLAAIEGRWQTSPAELMEALSELMAYNVIATRPGSLETDPEYQVYPSFRWGEDKPWPPPKGLPVFPGSK